MSKNKTYGLKAFCITITIHTVAFVIFSISNINKNTNKVDENNNMNDFVTLSLKSLKISKQDDRNYDARQATNAKVSNKKISEKTNFTNTKSTTLESLQSKIPKDANNDYEQKEQIEKYSQISNDDKYTKEIKNIIKKHHKYPQKLKNMGIKGEIELHFNINTNGELVNTIISKKSKHIALNEYALKTLITASKQFPKPNKNYTLSITLVFL